MPHMKSNWYFIYIIMSFPVKCKLHEGKDIFACLFADLFPALNISLLDNSILNPTRKL